MMKINGIDGIVKNGIADKSAREEPAANDDFKKILKASVERTAQHSAKVQQPLSINPISAIRMQPLSPEIKHATVDRVEKLLNLLDIYRTQLSDPAMTLRKIEPAMNTIIKEKEQLSSVLDSLADDDGLKDIVNRTLITASLEVIKYNRGDYITS